MVWGKGQAQYDLDASTDPGSSPVYSPEYREDDSGRKACAGFGYKAVLNKFASIQGPLYFAAPLMFWFGMVKSLPLAVVLELDDDGLQFTYVGVGKEGPEERVMPAILSLVTNEDGHDAAGLDCLKQPLH
jgi:hypothetical protein